MREVDKRVKQRPTQADINNINLVVSEIVNREQQQHSINPNRKPFEYLWCSGVTLCVTLCVTCYVNNMHARCPYKTHPRLFKQDVK